MARNRPGNVLNDKKLQENADNLSDSDDIADFSDSGEEDEIVQNDMYNSETEQSGSDEDDEGEPLQNEEDMDYRFYIGKDEDTIWKSTPVASCNKSSAKNIIRERTGPKGSAKHVLNPLDSFLLFITPATIDSIVIYTNIFISNRRANNAACQRDRNCKLTSRNEIQALFRVLFLLAVKKGNHVNVQEVWARDGTGMIRLRAAFGYKRFLFLLRALRFDDIETRKDRENVDKLAAIRSVYTDFLNNCMSNYSLGEFVTIDEMLHPFRGRCGFVQYMPQKPAKYGIKLYALCDSKTYYTWKFEIYCGTQRDGPYKFSNKSFDIVQRLVDPIKNSNRNVTTDNYYTSHPLCKDLLQNGLTLVGTLKKNKKEIPSQFLPNKTRTVGSSIFGFQSDVSLVSYVPKRNKAVLLLSTMTNTDEIDEDTGKPLMILDYNSTKCGVDIVDQKCATYTTQRITRRWPLAIFFRILDIAGINAEVIYKTNKPQKPPLRRRKFLTQLGFSLMEDHLKDRAKILTLPKDVIEFLLQFQMTEDPTRTVNQNRIGRCHICSAHKNNKTTVTCDSCQQFVCKQHCEKKVSCNQCLYPPMEED